MVTNDIYCMFKFASKTLDRCWSLFQVAFISSCVVPQRQLPKNGQSSSKICHIYIDQHYYFPPQSSTAGSNRSLHTESVLVNNSLLSVNNPILLCMADHDDQFTQYSRVSHEVL